MWYYMWRGNVATLTKRYFVMAKANTATAAGAKAAPAATKKGQAAKQPAPVQGTRTYPTVPKGFGCHGMYNAAGVLNPQGHVPAAQAYLHSPKQLGVTPSVGIPSGNAKLVMCTPQPGMGQKYQSAYACVNAAYTAACKAHGTKQPTVAQLNAHIAPWPANKPKANSALRHVARALGVAWQWPTS